MESSGKSSYFSVLNLWLGGGRVLGTFLSRAAGTAARAAAAEPQNGSEYVWPLPPCAWQTTSAAPPPPPPPCYIAGRHSALRLQQVLSRCSGGGCLKRRTKGTKVQRWHWAWHLWGLRGGPGHSSLAFVPKA